MITKFKVAAVQMNLKGTSLEIKKRIHKYMHKAKSQGVDILCFPEDVFYEGPKKNRELIRDIQEECKEHKLWCVLTSHVSKNKRTFNTAFVINGEGRIVGKHEKVHVCDSSNVRPGADFEVINTSFCKIGIAICWDLSNPNALRSMAQKGVKLVFCPLYWCYDEWSHHKDHKKHEKKILESLVLIRSFENLIYVVLCNPYNKGEKNLVSYSAISEPHQILTEIFDKEGMIVADIDLKRIDHLRKMYKKDYNTKITKT